MLGNKVDLQQQEVTKQDAELMASSYNFSYLEVSAKKNINIDKAFSLLADQMYLNRKRLYPDNLITSIKLHEDEKGRGKCCFWEIKDTARDLDIIIDIPWDEKAVPEMVTLRWLSATNLMKYLSC